MVWVDTQIGFQGIIRLMETLMWWHPVPTCQEWGRLNEEMMDSASTSAWEKAAPTAFALKSDNSFLPRTSLAPFKLLP